MQDRLDAGNQALGRLDGITLLLPDPDQFLYMFIRKEAVLSSQIEGTQSSLSDLLLFENDAAPGVPRDDAQVSANYIAAMNHGIAEIRGRAACRSATGCSGTCTRFFFRPAAERSGAGRDPARPELARRQPPVERTIRPTAMASRSGPP